MKNKKWVLLGVGGAVVIAAIVIATRNTIPSAPAALPSDFGGDTQLHALLASALEKWRDIAVTPAGRLLIQKTGPEQHFVIHTNYDKASGYFVAVAARPAPDKRHRQLMAYANTNAEELVRGGFVASVALLTADVEVVQ